MAQNRDDFSKKTIDILAKRVGYLCCKPDCRRPTVGPHSNVEKTTITGIAAHITAAAPGGARYNINLTPHQRKHINNGIWLCSYHAGLVDKDEDEFPETLLKAWKRDAEIEMQNAISGKGVKIKSNIGVPFLEAELLWSSTGRYNKGYDPKKNFEKFGGNVIYPSDYPIFYWQLKWDFSIVVYNNSQYPAYNVRLKEVGDKHFSYIEPLSKKNNLPPFANLDLETKYEELFEGTSIEADEKKMPRIPDNILGLTLEMIYEDDSRQKHITKLTITGPPDYIINERL